MINRREFVGGVLASLGGLFFPRKLFAQSNYLSSEEVFERIVKKPQYAVNIRLFHPKFTRRSGKSISHSCECLSKFAYGNSTSRAAFVFRDKVYNLENWFDIDNIKIIYICPTGGPAPSRDFDPWVRYEHLGNDQWFIGARYE